MQRPGRQASEEGFLWPGPGCSRAGLGVQMETSARPSEGPQAFYLTFESSKLCGASSGFKSRGLDLILF